MAGSREEVSRAQGRNIFAQLMETAKVASVGQMSRALYDVGGQYRRSM
jgi:methylmalonyl-CoA mutase